MNRGLSADAKGTFNKSKKRQASPEEKEEDYEMVVDWIWHKINPNYMTHISKQQLTSYLLNDEDVREVFDLKDNYIVHIIEGLITERPGHLNYDEFFDFLLKNKAKP